MSVSAFLETIMFYLENLSKTLKPDVYRAIDTFRHPLAARMPELKDFLPRIDIVKAT